MTLLYSDAVFQEHQTGKYHPENPQRLRPVTSHLQWTGLDACCKRASWQPLSRERLARVHSPSYVEELSVFAEQGGGWIDEDTVIGPRSFEVALWAAGAVCDAVERVIRGEDTHALCLVRPPGHHAMPAAAMGFCLFNNVALGARLATDELGLDRVLIIDWDVHHGNGTQAAFWQDGRVGFFSIHRWPFYPGTGAADETGAGDGIGMTLNVPVEFGTPRGKFIEKFRAGLQTFAERVKPQLILISAGFDAHRKDPVGSLGLETQDFQQLTEIVSELAVDSGGRIVSVLEGGYNPDVLTDCIEIHLHGLLKG